MRRKKLIYPNLLAEIARGGYNVTSIAAAMNLSRSALYKKLDGNTEFTLSDMTSLQKILSEINPEVTIDYLFMRAD